ncbi:general odorant-binding protein 19d-like [Anopheles albimanus]|uniref:Odorant-binding protein 13 n=1 Tax=Anopheles albimanus TaxID=7167 RepID=A0A182FSF5_ANOAL|nr:general odorant-binding protein 19d-like [Anopheles albimanus]
MKHITVVLLFLGLSIVGTQADEVSEAKEMLRGLAAECKQKEGASDDDVENFVNDVMPDSRTQKCLAGCMQEQFGVSDGKAFQPDGFVELSKMLMKGDEKKMVLAKEIAADCKDVAHEDRCELAVLIMNCLKESAEKHGIPLKH